MNGMYEELIEKLRKNNRMSGWTHIDRLIDEAAEAIEALQAEIVYCPKCKYSDFSKTIEYAYTCKNRLSPCRNRIAAANFGCTYGERKESDNDA